MKILLRKIQAKGSFILFMVNLNTNFNRYLKNKIIKLKCIKILMSSVQSLMEKLNISFVLYTLEIQKIK